MYLGLYHALFAGLLGWLRKLYSPTDCVTVRRTFFVGCH